MRRTIFRAVLAYAVCTAILAVVLAELAFHPARKPGIAPSFQTVAAKFDAELQDVSIASSDGAQLQGWFGRPSQANGDTIILLHGVGDNRQGVSTQEVSEL